MVEINQFKARYNDDVGKIYVDPPEEPAPDFGTIFDEVFGDVYN